MGLKSVKKGPKISLKWGLNFIGNGTYSKTYHETYRNLQKNPIAKSIGCKFESRNLWWP